MPKKAKEKDCMCERCSKPVTSDELVNVFGAEVCDDCACAIADEEQEDT